MNTNNNWKDYECIKTGNGEKLERWNNIILIRPDPQIIWNEKSYPEEWKNENAVAAAEPGACGWHGIRNAPGCVCV